MKKWIEKAGRILALLLCMAMCISCASLPEIRGGQGIQDGKEIQKEWESQDEKEIQEEWESQDEKEIQEEWESQDGKEIPEEQETQKERGTEAKTNTQEIQMTQMPEQEQNAQEEAFSPERQMQANRELFLEKAKVQNVETDVAEEMFERLMDDRIFQDGGMALTGLIMDDIDGNGQLDMLVMALDAEERPFYGSGGLWFYMNEDEPYCFEEEYCSFYGWFDAFWADIDNDENMEIVFSAEGTGCGAVGDSYKAVFKYKDHAIERMALPSDLEESYDYGLRVELVQEPQKNLYSAYCSYFDELIVFRGENIEGWEPPASPQIVGGNARGYYNLCVVEYEGKKVLQASEYLFGEGGIVHNVATAQFLITWEKDGTPKALKWWVEEYINDSET